MPTRIVLHQLIQVFRLADVGDIDVLLGLRDEADEGGGGADVAPVSVIGKMRHAADLIAGEDSAV